jgi:hypothetical protein
MLAEDTSGYGAEAAVAARRQRMDGFVTRAFPWLILFSLILVLLIGWMLRASSFADYLYAVCLGFVFGFCLLGLLCSFMMDRGVIRSWIGRAVILVMPLLIGLVLFEMGEGAYPNIFMIRFFNIFGDTVTCASVVFAVYSLFVAVYLVSVGVASVVVSYFRTNTHRILRYIRNARGDVTLKKRFTYRFFEIPDIIDVEDVRLDPEPDDGSFNRGVFLSMFSGLFSLGVVVCSYMFLNPLFLTEMRYDEMLIIAMMISMFLSTLVIPWNIMRTVGAHVISQARPYYLWKGMKNRLYQGFFAIAFIVMILSMSAYFGMDFSRIAMTYLGYVLFMALIAGLSSFVYVNNFYNGFREGIAARFNRD